MIPLPRYNEKGELDTRLTVDLVTGDVGIGTPKLEQKIVAWGVFEGNLHDMFFTQEEAQEMAKLKGSHAEMRPLYTHPPQRTWVGLTVDEIAELVCNLEDPENRIELGQKIETKLKEKNL
jgi:hypothetical protein